MGEPLSVAASAVGIVTLGLTVCSALIDYYSAWKDQPSDVAAMCESLGGLRMMFEQLNESVRHPLLDRKIVDRVTNSIIDCAGGVQRLQSKLDKIRNVKRGMFSLSRGQVGPSMRWRNAFHCGSRHPFIVGLSCSSAHRMFDFVSLRVSWPHRVFWLVSC
jgi:hypothetical protein